MSKAKVISEKPLISFSPRLDESDMCMGFVISGETGTLRRAAHYDAFPDVLDTALQLRNELDAFIVDGKAFAIKRIQERVAVQKNSPQYKKRMLALIATIKAVGEKPKKKRVAKKVVAKKGTTKEKSRAIMYT